MRTLFWKELREQFKVAAIGLVVLTILLTITFRQSTDQLRDIVSHGYSGRTDALQPILSSTLMMEMVLFCGAFGALLGWLQIRGEKHRDLWAFLIHRPITRNQILWSKIAAGLSLYVIGTIIPLAVFVGVIAIPGNVAAPFRWGMTLPMLAIVLVGTVYYIAALLTALRRARWFGSRIFAMGPPILTSLFIFSAPEAWQAFAMIPVAILIMLTTVWGGFRTDGWYRGQAAGSKVMLTFTCWVSSLLLVGVVLGGGALLFVSRVDQTFTHYQISREGVVWKITQRGRDIVEVVDLEGKPVLDVAKLNPLDFYKRLANAQTIQAYFNIDDGFNRYSRFVGATRFFMPWRIADKALWYLTRDGVLEGYDGLTRRRISTISPVANASSGGPGSRFLAPQNYYYTTFNYAYDQKPPILASSTTVYRIDLGKAEAQPLYTVPPGESIAGFQSPEWFDGRNLSGIFFVTREKVRLIDREGKVMWEVPYVPSYPVYSVVSVSFFQNPSTPFAVRFDPDPMLNAKSNNMLVSHVEWLAEDGTIKKSEQLPKISQSQRRNWDDDIMTTLLLPIPSLFVSESKSEGVWIILKLGIPILCAAVGWWLGTRYSFSRKAKFGWVVFLLLSGASGLLAFLAVQEWPAREPCPSCRKLRVVDRETCEHCGSKFAPPETNGTEIFEPLEVG